MTIRNIERWGAVSQILHWTIVLLVLGLAIVGLTMDELPRTPKYFWVYTAHKSIGLTVLALHGVAREVVLDVRINARKRHPMPPFRRTLGFSASTTLSRADFGLDAWKSMVGDAIELHIEGEATRARGAGDATPKAEEPGT